MKSLSSAMVAGLVTLALAGCASTPSSSIKTPLTARAAEPAPSIPHNGAIFQAGKNEHPLFEDIHARSVGDILTISIVETTSTSSSSSKSQSHAGTSSAGTPAITRGIAAPGSAATTLLNPIDVTTSSSGSLNDKNANTGANAFSGTITVTVIEVLPNGNLLVGGEKMLAIDQDNEFIRISGVVNPKYLSGNTILSSQVSDVHLEYKGAENMDSAQMLTVLGRAFRSILPF
jgi:flagellar L-ring protein precursor FlgH